MNARQERRIHKKWCRIAAAATRRLTFPSSTFAALFGVDGVVAEQVYRTCRSSIGRAPPRRTLLYGLRFLKAYPSDLDGAHFFAMSPHTWRIRFRFSLRYMHRGLPEAR